MGAAAGGLGGFRARPSCGGRHSFAPTTRVVMADGSTKPIAEINIGDKVKATDPATGKTEAKPVMALHLNRDKALTTVTLVAAGGATAVLATTQNHPFWDATSKTWVEAAKLVSGTSTTSSAEGAAQTVTRVDNHVGSQIMRDLTVADIHTYYVVAGGTPVLVHNDDNLGFEENSCPALGAARALADASRTPARGRPAVAEAIQLRDGNVISATSGGTPRLNPQVDAILDSVPPGQRGAGHGTCGFVKCVSTALDNGLDVREASAAAVTVTGPNNPSHGKPIGPCPSCAAVSEVFDTQWETF
jgi:hypothetical protein